jgi:hypothetical protein
MTYVSFSALAKRLHRRWAVRPGLVLHAIPHEARGDNGVPRPYGVLDVALLEPVGRHDRDSVTAVGIGALGSSQHSV